MTSERTAEGSSRAVQGEPETEVDRLRRLWREAVETRDRLIQISTSLNSTLNLNELLRLISASAKELFQVEAVSIMLLNEATGELVFEVAVGAKGEEVIKHRLPAGKGIAGRVLQCGEPIILETVEDNPDFYEAIDKQVGFKTENMLAAPLKVKDRVIGVVEAINTYRPAGFVDEDLALASALSNLAAVAIENARLYEKLADSLVAARMSYRL